MRFFDQLAQYFLRPRWRDIVACSLGVGVVMGTAATVVAAPDIEGSVAVAKTSSSSTTPLAATSTDLNTYDYQRGGRLLLDAGASFGFPTALTTGLSTGATIGATVGECPLRWGVRAAWVTTTESTLVWAVTHSDMHLRLTGSAHYDRGRGAFAIRAAVGPTLIHESKLRNQGMRAGLTGSDLQTSAWRLAPAVDLEAVVQLHVAGPWMIVISAGPSAALVGSKLRGSWNAEIGVAWQL